LSRLFYVVFNFNQFGFDLAKFILINGYPGLTLYGFVIGAGLTFYIYTNIKKIKFFDVIDYLIPGGFLVLAFGKLGSFFSGSEAATTTKFFLEIKYRGLSGTRHLTAFYESLLFFAAVVIAYKMIFTIRREKLAKGTGFYFFIWFFSLVYFLFDKLKVSHLYFLNYSFNKAVSTALLLTFSFYFVYHFRSLWLGQAGGITSFLRKYGQQTVKNIHRQTKKTLGGGKDKDHSSN